jgi:hypothetical protein
MWLKVRITATVVTVVFAWFALVMVGLGSQLWPLLAGVR